LLKTILIGISMSMAAAMYIPLFRRIVRRKHTRDFSKEFSWMLVIIQINNGALAIAERAPFLLAWYILQTAMCAAQLLLVYKYWNEPEPLMRSKS